MLPLTIQHLFIIFLLYSTLRPLLLPLSCKLLDSQFRNPALTLQITSNSPGLSWCIFHPLQLHFFLYFCDSLIKNQLAYNVQKGRAITSTTPIIYCTSVIYHNVWNRIAIQYIFFLCECIATTKRARKRELR